MDVKKIVNLSLSRNRGRIRRSGRDGFTRNEFFVASSVLLLIIGLAVPGFIRRRNESAAIQLLQRIAALQNDYAESCGSGGYAETFSVLNYASLDTDVATIAGNFNQPASVRQKGYNFTLRRAGNAGSVDCHHMPTHATYIVTAEPTTFGISGVRSFAINSDRVIWQIDAATVPAQPFAAPAAPLDSDGK